MGSDTHLYDYRFDADELEVLKTLLDVQLFPQVVMDLVVKDVAAQSPEGKKLVYLYLVNAGEIRNWTMNMLQPESDIPLEYWEFCCCTLAGFSESTPWGPSRCSCNLASKISSSPNQ